MISAIKKRLIGYAKDRLPPTYPYKGFNDAHRAIFIHIPKTAGTSIRAAMGAPETGRLHIEYTHFLLADRRKFQEYFKFCVVRDPLSRIHSCYRYLLKGGNQTQKDLGLSATVRQNCANFDDFVGFVQENQLHALWPLLRPQACFVCDVDGTLMVDMVLHQERLASEYAGLVSNVPTLDRALQMLNAAETADRVSHAPPTLAVVRHLYQRDYATFYS